MRLIPRNPMAVPSDDRPPYSRPSPDELREECAELARKGMHRMAEATWERFRPRQ